MKEKLQEKNAITLISLVVTIIILIILAGVSIHLVLGDSGIVRKAKQGKANYLDAQIAEQEMLEDFESQFDESFQNERLEISENTENINTSAKVSSIEDSTITIQEETLKLSTVTGNFKKDDTVMLYASNSTDVDVAGKFEVYQIRNVEENMIQLNKKIDTTSFTNENCQIIKIASYKEVKITNNAIITPSKYDGNSGGIIAIDAYEIQLEGKIDASFCGYDVSNTAPNNGGLWKTGNRSLAGGSNKYKGGDGGRNYQGDTAYASEAVGKSGDILSTKQMYFGGGSQTTKGGGIIYISCLKLKVGSQYAISANGQGGNGENVAGGGAGGSICLNSKQIVFLNNDKDYFIAANGRKWSN